MRSIGFLLAAVLGLWAGPGTAQEPRSFRAIEVEGNARFSDGDIIASSGLRPGVAVSEHDLIAAVEALDYTGEFRSVRIVSQGEVLVIAVEEQPAHAGNLVFGLGYDTDLGIVGSGAVDVEDIFAPGMTLGGSFEISEQVQAVDVEISSLSFWGEERGGGVMGAFANYNYDNTTYDFRTAAVAPFVTRRLGERAWLEVRYTLATGDIRNVEADASPIIHAEEGQLWSSGAGFSLVMDNLRADGSSPPNLWTLRFDQDFTGLGGDTRYSRSELSLFGRAALGESGLAIRSRVEVGRVMAVAGGDDPRASDRFALGGSSLRGFELGTVNPRDVCAGCAADGGDVITNLGGNSYAVARTDLILPRIPRLGGIEVFVFGDIGSAWDVETDTAPAGELRDAHAWRSSAGVGLSWSTPLGDMEGYYSLVENREDHDDAQKFGLTFRTRF